MGKIVKLQNDKERRSRQVAKILRGTVRTVIAGDVPADLAGFALVAWNGRGEAVSAHYTDTGPVSSGLMPAYVHDALNRMIALELAQSTSVHDVTGDE